MDTIVVGAGVAGLVAADRLAAAGRDVLVVEARDRVGGRTLTTPVPDMPGVTVDQGGQWIGPGQDRVRAELDRFGLATFAQPTDGDAVVHFRGSARRYRGQAPKIGAAALLDVAQAQRRFDRLAGTVDLTAPWRTPRALELDAQTFESWIRRTLRTERGRDFLRIATQAVFATEPANLSLLHALFYARSGTSLETLISTAGGAQQDRVVGGMQQLAERLAGGLEDRVKLNKPVRGIVQDGTSVRVHTDGESYSAERVVVAVSPALSARLSYAPALPADRDQLVQRMPHGSVIKCHAVYEEPFWRTAGLSGEGASDTGPVKVVFDATPPAEAQPAGAGGGSGRGRPGVLLGFAEGREAIELARLDASERRQQVLSSLARFVGPRALEPRVYLERDWSAEEWTRGCYGAHLPPGAWTQLGPALRRPVGRIHWAGAETAERWCGYIDGAISSGERAAAEVIAATS